jgi:hypothetical protein
MGFFKLGVGYRLTPRSEAVLNFVIERSSAETANIGTVSAANVPLNVDFEDYNYWGFEGGQRFYFARARFTPYVGYLVGINRELGIVAFLKGNIGAAPTLMQPAYQPQSNLATSVSASVHGHDCQRALVRRVRSAREGVGGQSIEVANETTWRNASTNQGGRSGRSSSTRCAACATLLLQAGQPVRVVSERIGHSNMAMTIEVYAHVL